jgi:hypothetical protein
MYTREAEAKKYEELLSNCRVFWAFNDKQLQEGKAEKLEKGEHYTSFGSGGFVPVSELNNFKKGMKEIAKWAKESKKNDKEVILYELNNYECFYTGDINEAMERLAGLGYTKSQVLKVYKSNYAKELQSI